METAAVERGPKLDRAGRVARARVLRDAAAALSDARNALRELGADGGPIYERLLDHQRTSRELSRYFRDVAERAASLPVPA
jgi:hypothetical protein